MSRRFVLLVLALLLALAPLSTWAKERCFVDKAPYCLVEPFSAYWASNGDLPVFGYPISVARSESQADSPQQFLTQWTERNRLEVHPENAGTPYEILLGRLGADRLAQMARPYDPPESGPQDGCLWFAETGINVCNQAGSLGFKTYWETHGLQIPGLSAYARSLQLFGLPLTRPQLETNAAGDTVLTQWFERARFEWHPNNPDNYKVLLGLLGLELRGGTGAVTPVNPADPCTDIPEPISGTLASGKCVKVGQPLNGEVYGFAPGESILMWDISETGVLTVVPNAATANAAGRLSINLTVTAEELGFWQWSFEGVTSKHVATLYFRGLPGDAPPPPPPPPPVTPSCNRSAGPGAPESPVRIVGLNKSAETVTIRNVSGQSVDVSGWWICSMTGNQLHAKLSGTIAAGQTLTIASQAGTNIWNNSSNDDGALFNAQGTLISFWDD